MQQRSHKQENSAIFWQCNLWNKYVYVISIDYFAFVDQYSWLLFIPSVYLFRICVVYVIFFDKHSTLKWLRVKECKIYFKKKKNLQIFCFNRQKYKYIFEHTIIVSYAHVGHKNSDYNVSLLISVLQKKFVVIIRGYKNAKEISDKRFPNQSRLAFKGLCVKLIDIRFLLD